MRAAITLLVLVALGIGGWIAYGRLTAGPAPVWVDLGSLLRHPPGRETLFEYDPRGECYRGDGTFLTIRRFSNYNREVQSGTVGPNLRLYLRNDDGDLVGLVVRDPRDGSPLAVNSGDPGFRARDGHAWDSNGISSAAKVPDLVRLPGTATSAHVRLNARTVTCPDALPESAP